MSTKHWITSEEISARYRGRRLVRAAKVRNIRKKKNPPYDIFATIYMPAIPLIDGDEEQARTLNLRHWMEQDFAQEMHENYALISPNLRPTFFHSLSP